MNTFKKSLMIGVMAGLIGFSTPGYTALSGAGAWTSIAASAGGLLLETATTFFKGGNVVGMLWGNVDPTQLAAEGLVLYQMYHTKDKWDPEPQKEYQQAAESNGGGSSGSSGGGVSYDSMLKTLTFQAASLKNVGIEAIGVGPMLAEIATEDTWASILEKLGWLQPKSAASSTKSSDSTQTTLPGAGSCAASYSVCSKYDTMSTEERDQVAARQRQNEQNYGTAGIAHAELGLKSVQQAIANDGGSAVGNAGTSSSAEKVTLVPGKTTTVQDLSGMIGTGANTVAAMKIVALMNLELAQRLNQGNMLQGSVLTIEAARAFQNTDGIKD